MWNTNKNLYYKYYVKKEAPYAMEFQKAFTY